MRLEHIAVTPARQMRAEVAKSTAVPVTKRWPVERKPPIFKACPP